MTGEDSSAALSSSRRGSMFRMPSFLKKSSEEAVKLDAMAADARDTLIEIDLGERTLLLQAWNIPNRDVWIESIRKWALNRRRVVDNFVGFSDRNSLRKQAAFCCVLIAIRCVMLFRLVALCSTCCFKEKLMSPNDCD